MDRQSKEKSTPNKPPVSTRSAPERAAQPSPAETALPGAVSAEVSQASLLSSASVPAGQRQGLAQGIGQVQGNRHLQRVLSSHVPAVQRDPNAAAPAATAAPTAQAAPAAAPQSVFEIVSTRYPGLIGVLTGQQMAEAQAYLDLYAENEGIRAYNRGIDEKEAKVTERYRREMPTAYMNLSEYNDAIRRLERKKKDLKQFRPVFELDSARLIDAEITAPQPWNVEAEAAFRQAWVEYLSSQPTYAYIPPDRSSGELFTFGWGEKQDPIPLDRGRYTWASLMKYRPFEKGYFWKVKDGRYIRELWRGSDDLRGRVDFWWGEHSYTQDQKNEFPVVSWISEVFGGAGDIPDMQMWLETYDVITRARQALLDKQPELAQPLLAHAEQMINQRVEKLKTYRADTMKGAGRAVTTLEIVKISSAVIITIGTGGLAAEAGLGAVATTTATAGVSATYGAAQNTAQQASSVAHGLTKEINWGGIAKQGAADFLSGLAGGAVGSKFSGYFQKTLGTRMAAMGYGARQISFVTGSLGSISSAPITAAQNVVIANIVAGKAMPKSAEEFAGMIVQEAATGIIGEAVGARFFHPGGATGFTDFTPGAGHTPAPDVNAPKPGADVPTPHAPDVAAGTGAPKDTTALPPGAEVDPAAPRRTDPHSPAGSKGGEPGTVDFPDGLVHYDLSRKDAIASYRESLDTDVSREAGIWMDPKTDKYLVVQGNKEFVETGWMRDSEFAKGRWILVEHYHPGDDLGARYASSEDYEAMLHRYFVPGAKPQAVSTRIRWKDPHTKIEFLTEIGYDPQMAKPYWIRFRNAKGETQTVLFGDTPWNAGSEYRRWLRSEGIPESLMPRRVTPDASAGQAQGGQAQAGQQTPAKRPPKPGEADVDDGPAAVVARDFFKQMIPQGKKGPYHPDKSRYPELVIMPNGDLIGPYNHVLAFAQAAEVTGGKGSDSRFEAHHIFEDNHAERFGIPRDEGVSVSVEKMDHDTFSAELPRQLNRRAKSEKVWYDIDETYRAHEDMYHETRHADWIPFMRRFLKRHKETIWQRYKLGFVPGAKDADYPQRLKRVRQFLDSL